jgi:hypothetical protein
MGAVEMVGRVARAERLLSPLLVPEACARKTAALR